MRILLTGLILLCFAHQLLAADVFQWRGPQRDGIYPEKNLLQEWPTGGPKLIWKTNILGEGHSSVAIVKDQIFTTGMASDSTGYVFAFDQKGNLRWKTAYGPEWKTSYPGARSTPTVVDNRVYIESGKGLVVCLDARNGKIIWTDDLLKKFNAENIKWGMTESLLIDGDRLICTPGGSEVSVVALNRFTGKTEWISPGNGQKAAYCSPILVHHAKIRILVTMLAKSIIGVNAQNGEFLWSFPHEQRNDIHANTPIYQDGLIYCSSTSPGFTVQLKLSPDGRAIESAWQNTDLQNLMGGAILRDNLIYTSGYRKGGWYVLDWTTGKILHNSASFKEGVIIYTGDCFYCYGEDGQFSLVQADSRGYQLKSSFMITEGSGQHWAHPVISNSRLYIRHGNVLLVYDISKK
ncbi:PQQ-like beta-propeller repeat protein [candidate division KSB1 bacterium]|nr:PQQ-like beta-propeller repeat protein [candidate division KSB1 bacterium]